MKLMAEWEEPEPDVEKLQQVLMQLGFYDLDIDMDNTENPHGWGV